MATPFFAAICIVVGFADDWRSLFAAIAQRAGETRWHGPLVLDELPYLVLQSPELPSALQQFVDHDARRVKLTIAIAGSSQRMMQGLVLDANAPLYGRARAEVYVPEMALVHQVRPVGTDLRRKLEEIVHG